MGLQSTQSSVQVCDHPLLCHNISILRDSNTSHDRFRMAIRRVSAFILQEATRDLPLSKAFVDTPICKAETKILSPEIPIIITPILRAGLMMCDVAMDLIPSASVYHVGLYRDEETLKPITYYNKLPSNIDYSQARIFLLDPMLATGGSATAAVEIVSKLGVREENIYFVSIISAPEGIEALNNRYPGVKIFTGALDERLNDKAYIVPGLGDAGDRMFGTV
jgi:uracil phosphoribosyltransferase